jgi:anti-sigma28 factor (negative regulator of flagellin synthesis)
MANSIRDIPGTLVGPATIVPNGSVRSAVNSNGNESITSPTDLTAVSDLAKMIRGAISQASSLSSFRPQLVAQIKSAIANQSYAPNPDHVATRIAAAIGRR